MLSAKTWVRVPPIKSRFLHVASFLHSTVKPVPFASKKTSSKLSGAHVKRPTKKLATKLGKVKKLSKPLQNEQL